MRFFVPSAGDCEHAEEAYRKICDHIATFIGPITGKRLYRLKYDNNGCTENVVVGSDHHCFGNAPVIAIFEGCDGVYFVCTQKNDTNEADPHPVHAGAVIDTEDFSALA
jgi:hypothetical protein